MGLRPPAPVWGRWQGVPILPTAPVSLRAPGCPRAAWVVPRPCPTRWRGPGRSCGRLQGEGEVWGGQTPLLMGTPHSGASLGTSGAEGSPLMSRTMSSNIWLWILPWQSTLQVCRGSRVSDQSTALAPFPAGPITCRLMVGATCGGHGQGGPSRAAAPGLQGGVSRESPSARGAGGEGGKNSAGKAEMASHCQGRLGRRISRSLGSEAGRSSYKPRKKAVGWGVPRGALPGAVLVPWVALAVTAEP